MINNEQCITRGTAIYAALDDDVQNKIMDALIQMRLSISMEDAIITMYALLLIVEGNEEIAKHLLPVTYC